MDETMKKFNKKDTYTYDEVREMIEGAIMDRARYLGAFYKVMPKELFDEYGKKALFYYGQLRGYSNFKGCEKGVPKVMADFLYHANGVKCTNSIGITITECDDDHAIALMEGTCALAEGWKKMGLSAEEVDYLCQIACYGDYGKCDVVGLKGSWICTCTQPGCDVCKFLIEKAD